MRVRFEKKFKKQYKKIDSKIQYKFDERLKVFLEDQSHPILKIHSLKGDRLGLMSMNVNADYRALFTWDDDLVIFYEIGKHSQLYS